MLRTGSLLLLLAITAVFCYQFQPPVVMPVRLFGVGAVYGIAVSWFGISSLLSSRLLRLGMQICVICLGSWWLLRMSQAAGEAWPRYATQLGGMALTQRVLLLFFHLPAWSWQSRTRPGKPPFENLSPTTKVSADSVGGSERLSQFSILDVILLTTAGGVLMGMAIRYRPPIDASEYWSVVLGLWVLFPLLAAWTIRMILDVGHFRSWYWLLAVVLLGALVSFGLSYLQTNQLPSVLSEAETQVETQVETEGPLELSVLWMRYGLVMLGFVGSVAMFAMVGRWSASTGDASCSRQPSRP